MQYLLLINEDERIYAGDEGAALMEATLAGHMTLIEALTAEGVPFSGNRLKGADTATTLVYENGGETGAARRRLRGDPRGTRGLLPDRGARPRRRDRLGASDSDSWPRRGGGAAGVGGIAEALMAARPRVVAALAARFGDLELAEDGFAAAVEIALQQPAIDDPAAFLFVTGRRKILDALRTARRAATREADYVMHRDADAELPAETADEVPDERLRLLFICCHPAIAVEARAMLALRLVLGASVETIASGFLLRPDAVRQRITRAKRKIREAGLPFELPTAADRAERVEALMLTLEQAFTAAYREQAQPELAAEVEHLSLLLTELLPAHGEMFGLAALILLARSREPARGLPLSEQDTALWDRERIEAARRLLDRDHDGTIGRFRLLALIHLSHARRLYDGATDWQAIATLYDALARLDPGPVVALNRAVALGRAGDPERGLAALPAPMPDYAPWHAARGDLLALAGRPGARASLRRALALTAHEAARALLERRLRALPEGREAR